MIFDRGLSGRARERPQNVVTAASLGLVSGSAVSSGANPGEQSALKLSAVNRCVEVLSDSMAKLPTYLMNANTRERIANHPVLQLLAVRPNEAMTPSVRKKMLECNRLCCGNAYDWIVRDSLSQRPKELIPVPAELVQQHVDDHGHVWYGITHPYSGALMVLPGEDVCHYKAYSHNGLTGQSVLSRAAEVIAAGRASQEYELNYYSNGGYPSGVLSTEEDLSGRVEIPNKDGTVTRVTKRDVIRSEWERIHSGPSNAHRLAVLDYGLKYQPISVSNKDLQFVESKAVSVEDIARFFGVPLYKLQAGKQSYSSNEQNAIEYVVGTLHPIVTQYEEEQTWKLLMDSDIRMGLEVRINMMAELRGDFASRGTWYKNMRECGAYNVNDIRALEDLPKVPGGDEYMASLNYVPLSLWRELSVNRNKNGGGA